jgi:hypothetical protein
MGAPVAIGTTLRREGGFNLRHCCAQMLKHMAYDSVVLDQKAIPLNLARGMAIADVPCELDQITGDFQQWLGSRDDLNHLTVCQCERVAIVQRGRMCKIHQKTRAFDSFENLAAQKSVFIN